MAIPTKPPVNPGAPNNITNKSTSDPSAPNTVTTKAQPSPTVPNTVTTKATSGPSNPNTITNKAASSPGVPNTITTETALSPSTPNTVTTKAPAAVPRVCNPLVALNFGDEKYSQGGNPIEFDSLFTYSRNTTATFINRRIDRLGRYEYFLDTDYVGNVENLVTYSEQFDNADWTKTNSTVTANKTANPIDGKRDADLYEVSSSGDLIQQSVSVTSGNNYNFSAYVKYNNEAQFVIVFSTGFTVSVCTFNILTGQIVSSTGSAFDLSIEFIRDGWYKISAANTATSTTNGVFRFASSSGSGGEKFYLWGAQITESSKPLPYVKTTASAVTQAFTESIRREYNPVTGEALGFLAEGDSTNLILRSEEFNNASWSKSDATITANSAVSVDGTESADKFIANTNNVSHILFQNASVVSGNKYTLSIFAKRSEYSFIQITESIGFGSTVFQNFNLSSGGLGNGDLTGASAKIDDFGNGWYRCQLTVEATSTVSGRFVVAVYDTDTGSRLSGFAGDGSSGVYVWGGQFEQQPFSTSYIRTEGSTVSRSADDLTLSPFGNMPNHDQLWAAHIEFDLIGFGGSDQRIFDVGSDSGQTRYSRISTSGITIGIDGSGSTTVISDVITVNQLTKHTITRTAINNRTDWYLNGELKGGLNVSPIPNQWPDFRIGAATTNSFPMFGHIKQLNIYDVALTAQEVALL